MKTCAKPQISNANITPPDAKIDFNAKYTIKCNLGYKQTGGTEAKCIDSDTFDNTPSCTSKL